MPFLLLEKECGPKCRSRKHVQEINSVIIYGNLTEFKAVTSLCHNWARHSDLYGRTALHMAASCGKVDILEWLLEEKKGDLSTKDFESGYTAVHRALFYGQLACARLLTQFGCDLQMRDTEGLSPLDLATADRPAHITFSLKEPNEVYTWGENNNSTLGHPSPHKRLSPEAVDIFKKSGISVKQILLCKYHSVFLSQPGQVYTCGHGQGGRLGHEDQHTVLVPRLLESLKEYTCLQIAAATDHTVLRMEGGAVFSFGLNPHHQLGQTPYLESSAVPKQMNLKPLKGKSVSGVCVGRFHSVVWTPDSVFTVGLNAGQLGHQKGEKYQSLLRQVSGLRHTDVGIARVSCSDAATVCLTTKGDVFVLHEYQCRKIASKWQDIEQVLAVGGTLDHNAGLDVLWEKGGRDLLVMMRNQGGQLFLWRSTSPSLKRCQFALRRQLAVFDVALTSSCMVLCTQRGEAYMGYLSNKKLSSGLAGKEQLSKEHTVKEFGDGCAQTRLLDLLLKDEVEELQVRRLPVIHRAVAVAADRKGGNFAVLQALPNGCLSELPSVMVSEMSKQLSRLHLEAYLGDSVHDAVLQLGERSWPVHKYILASRSDYMRNLVMTSDCGETREGECPVLSVGEDLSAELMEQLLLYIYTDTCDYLQLGHIIKPAINGHLARLESLNKPQKKKVNMEESSLDNFVPAKRMSAFCVQQKRNSKGFKKDKGQKSDVDVKEGVITTQSPIKLLQDAARRLGVKGLAKRLDAVMCSNNVIVSQGKTLARPRVKFDRTKLPELYDVTIRTEDGYELGCHKCVLVARLDYFYSMLATGWAESQDSSILTLPVSADVLEVLIDFLYTDEATELRDCVNEELLGNVLVVSDQLLAWRLKEMCEVALANIISFKNVGELLEFSSLYNAEQLKASCQQFVCLNLAAVMEGRYLDILSPETAEELTVCYRTMIPSMSKRQITRGEVSISEEFLSQLVSAHESLSSDDSFHPIGEPGSGKKGGKQQQKKRSGRSRQKISSEEGEKSAAAVANSTASVAPVVGTQRNLSVNSDFSDDLTVVIEEVNRRIEEDEKKFHASSAKLREKLKWRLMPLSGTSALLGGSSETLSRPQVPTQPDEVPKWNANYKTLSWPVQSPPLQENATMQLNVSTPDSEEMFGSPVSQSCLASSPTSLRDIMQRETQPSDKRKSSFSGRVSWKDVKKQQNRESRERHSQQKCQPQDELEKPALGQLPNAPSNPWNSISGVVKSFRDLMLLEEGKVSIHPSLSPTERAPPPGSRKTSAGSVSPSAGALGKSPPRGSTCWGLAAHSGAVRSIPFSSPLQLCSPPPASTENPWTLRAASQQASSPPASSAPFSTPQFSAILQDEKEKTETLERAVQKPLGLIQIEEKAMSELLLHYEAHKRVDEYISVERVSRAMATPLWRRERRPSGTPVS
ncbi:inhibitor of Bruton tyrosine kinase [Aplysia californica]|uniref:Inhibitor of Bruton tyrosine kinase n=1 Tax=Aplysia californica TaxID=6500 RepID=A0ABM0JUH7_APLCA|nr:inhibitor of Bruton tyrosine kinase [Aplysia californica]XP_005101797.1 inhibitor of Bruton tyrosine kinase [Aplysia californica]